MNALNEYAGLFVPHACIFACNILEVVVRWTARKFAEKLIV
jgi:hypothetical protein